MGRGRTVAGPWGRVEGLQDGGLLRRMEGSGEGAWRETEGKGGTQRAPRGDIARAEAWEDPRQGAVGLGRRGHCQVRAQGMFQKGERARGPLGVCGEEA